MSQPSLEKKENPTPAVESTDYRAELMSYQNRAILGMILGILSIPLSFICVFPVGLFAFFLGVQSQAGLIKLEVMEGRDRATIARVCGGIGTVLFFVNLMVQFLRYKGILRF